MKIQPGQTGAEAVTAHRLEPQPGVNRPTQAGRPGDTRSDSVRLSSDAALATAAAREAAASPEIRQDRVEAARRALEEGKLGSDPLALADRIIDSLLER
ncbi:MAG TPA: flagellar biosynthesis anti-sigma factor FlgM [Vicinamibacterales bacterium]